MELKVIVKICNMQTNCKQKCKKNFHKIESSQHSINTKFEKCISKVEFGRQFGRYNGILLE